MEYKFSGSINFEDYVQFNEITTRNITFAKKIVLVFCIAAFIISRNLLNFKKGISLNDSTTIIDLIILIVLIIFLLMNFKSKRRYKKPFESNKSISEECTYTINETNITIDTKNSHTVLNKDAIYKILFDMDSIYIYSATNLARVIKKRFLENEEQFLNLVLFLDEHYKECINRKTDT
jgi:hypothetical protein